MMITKSIGLWNDKEAGEGICTSDSMTEIREAAKLRSEETDGECSLFVMERLTV